MTRFFVEEPRFNGTWAPAIYHGARPAEKRNDGGRRRFRSDPVEVNPGHHRLTLDQLTEVYGVDGRFRATGKGGSA